MLTPLLQSVHDIALTLPFCQRARLLNMCLVDTGRCIWFVNESKDGVICLDLVSTLLYKIHRILIILYVIDT